ncbi:MAG: 5'/3'-nucleotidase SurE [bacterium]|nr:5'/3'-nucleotidase SurE [bacterium]
MTKVLPTILVSNDDGLGASGLSVLGRHLGKLGRVVIVSPDRQRSAGGHAITLKEPIRIKRIPDGIETWVTTGTPADCILIGIYEIIKDKVDLVVSGINHGANVGIDITYSGTVSAAMEGVICGIPSIAVSLASYSEVKECILEMAGDFTRKLAELVLRYGLPKDVLLNVNIPPIERPLGVRFTHQGSKRYLPRIIKRFDPSGEPYYWLDASPIDNDKDGSDLSAIRDGYISITPIKVDMTDYEHLDEVKELYREITETL